MNQNVGKIDRVIRFLIGVVFFGLTLSGAIGWWGWVVGGITMVTALMGWCPPYAMLGISTCPTKSSSES